MARVPVSLHPQADAELFAARSWYHTRSPQVADAFLAEIDTAIEAISDGPHRWPRIYTQYRRFPMASFPFNVIYLELKGAAVVIAVAHHRRRPGYWQQR